MYVAEVPQRLPVPNSVQSANTRSLLVESALESLVEVGFARTTGVEVCRRAGVTRGALQHHFPEFGQLLAAALGCAYDRLLGTPTVLDGVGPLERWVHQASERVQEREFKAVIELWLGSRNDPVFGVQLTDAILQGSRLFDPTWSIEDLDATADPQTVAIYRTISEALFGLGLGAASHGEPLGHSDAVVSVLLELARDCDARQFAASSEALATSSVLDDDPRQQ